MFVNPEFDPDNKYAVPWQWGTTGIAYRADKVTPAPDSWGIFLDPKYKGKMTQMDDLRDVLGSWLKYRGKSMNSTDKASPAAHAAPPTPQNSSSIRISPPIRAEVARE